MVSVVSKWISQELSEYRTTLRYELHLLHFALYIRKDRLVMPPGVFLSQIISFDAIESSPYLYTFKFSTPIITKWQPCKLVS
jgi:hypothetical protein